MINGTPPPTSSITVASARLGLHGGGARRLWSPSRAAGCFKTAGRIRMRPLAGRQSGQTEPRRWSRPRVWCPEPAGGATKTAGGGSRALR
jgi:hypothetical protein